MLSGPLRLFSRYLAALSRNGSFSAFITSLRSYPISASASYGFREPRQVRLTPDGEALLGYSRRLLRLNEEAVRYFLSPSLEGKIGIGTSDDVGTRILPKVLAEFSRAYPAVTINVVVGSSKDNLARLEAGKSYRIAYTCEHCSGQEAAMAADLAIAPFPKSIVRAPLKEITGWDLPTIGMYQLALARRGANELNDILAHHVKKAFRELQ